MLQVSFKLFAYLFNRCIRHIYWLYQLSRIKGISNIKLHFPIIVEGRGFIKIGSNSVISKWVKLRLADKTKLSMGENCYLADNTDITIANSGVLKTGDNVHVGFNTRLYINNVWSFGHDVKTASNCAIFSRERGHYGKLTIGNGTHIGDNTIIDVSDDIHIGSEVAIGPKCVIYTHDHDYTNKDEAAWKGGVIKGQITIEESAWIGSGVTILPGVTIGSKAVVAAGSVVTKSIPARTVWGGIPAKQIKTIE